MECKSNSEQRGGREVSRDQIKVFIAHTETFGYFSSEGSYRLSLGATWPVSTFLLKFVTVIIADSHTVIRSNAGRSLLHSRSFLHRQHFVKQYNFTTRTLAWVQTTDDRFPQLFLHLPCVCVCVCVILVLSLYHMCRFYPPAGVKH